MSNSRTRTTYYTPRYTQMEAYDLLPLPVRDALKEGSQEWDTGSVLREYRKIRKTKSEEWTIKYIVQWIWGWHREEVMNGQPWRQAKPRARYKHLPPSPHVQAGVTMLTSYSERPASIPSF